MSSSELREQAETMRIIVERWYVGPIVAAVALFGCWVNSLGTATARFTDVTRATLDRVYILAGAEQYDEILREGLASNCDFKSGI